MEGNFEKLVERVLILRDENSNTRHEIRLQIGSPYWTEEGVEAACPVAIEGYLGRLEDIRGIDPLDALNLAIQFVDSILRSLPKTKKVLWPSGEGYFQEA